MPKIVVTSPVFPETLAFLAAHGTVEVNDSLEPWPDAALRARCADAAALLAFMPDRVDAAFLAACPALKVVACALKGWDNFDRDACTRAGVWLSVVPDLLTEPTAELALALALALGRNLLAGDGLVRTGAFRGWRAQLYGTGIAGSTVGIAGTGRVGSAIARRVAGFGPARMLGYDATPPNPALGLTEVTWPALLATCDLVFLALPLAAGTHHLLGEAALRAIKPGCLVVNAGRGSVVDEAAVAAALGAGRLGGYAADVFEMEDWALPGRPRAIGPALLHSPRTVFTPHLGSAVADVRRAIEQAAAFNLVEALAGRVPPDALNHPVGAGLRQA